MFEERGEDLVFDVLWFYTIRGTALLHHLQTHKHTESRTVKQWGVAKGHAKLSIIPPEQINTSDMLK